MRAISGGLLLVVGLLACSVLDTPERGMPAGSGSTFERFREQAVAGDPESQNLVGFMLFLGEGVAMDRPRARRWFERAAAAGNMSAQLNLALMYFLGAGAPYDPVKASRYFAMARDNEGKPGELVSQLVFSTLPELAEQSCLADGAPERPGQETFSTYCAGCHGFNGLAAYIGSPSFALGERMEKSDGELLASISSGHGVMPRWNDKLPAGDLEDALAYVRSLRRTFNGGILHELRKPPSRYYLFGPMTFDFDHQPVDTVYYYDDGDPSPGLCGRATGRP